MHAAFQARDGFLVRLAQPWVMRATLVDGSGNRDGPGFGQALSVMNDTLVTTRVRQATANSTVGKVLASTQDGAPAIKSVAAAVFGVVVPDLCPSGNEDVAVDDGAPDARVPA